MNLSNHGKFFLGLFLGMLLVIIAGFVAVNDLLVSSQSRADYDGAGCGGEIDCTAQEPFGGAGFDQPFGGGGFGDFGDPGVTECKKCTGWNIGNPVCQAKWLECMAKQFGGGLPTPTPDNRWGTCVLNCQGSLNSCYSRAGSNQGARAACFDVYQGCYETCGILYQ